MYWNFIHYLFNHFFPDSVRHYSATFVTSAHGCKFKDTCLLRWLHIFAALNFSLTNMIPATQLLSCTCMHVPKSCILILCGKCFIRKIQWIICFACRSVLIYCCYDMLYFLQISFLQICIYANRSELFDLYALFPHWNIRYFVADAYSPYTYYTHFVLIVLLVTKTSWNRLHVFTLNFA